MGYTYIVVSQRNGTIYIGVTSNLQKRILEHKAGTYEGFTKKYGCKILVWYQEFQDIQEAIGYEKKIKGWNRKKKIALIEKSNPGWDDLFI